MKSITTHHESLRLPGCGDLPAIDVRFGACRASGDAHFYDVLDFKTGAIDRWFIPPEMLCRS